MAQAILAFYDSVGLRCYDAEAGFKADGTTETPVFPYAVLTMASPVQTSEHMTSQRERAEFDCTVSYHGTSPRSARWAADRVGMLSGVHLSMTGRVGEAESIPGGFLRKDDDNQNQIIWSGASNFVVTSYPA